MIVNLKFDILGYTIKIYDMRSYQTLVVDVYKRCEIYWTRNEMVIGCDCLTCSITCLAHLTLWYGVTCCISQVERSEHKSNKCTKQVI